MFSERCVVLSQYDESDAIHSAIRHGFTKHRYIHQSHAHTGSALARPSSHSGSFHHSTRGKVHASTRNGVTRLDLNRGSSPLALFRPCSLRYADCHSSMVRIDHLVHSSAVRRRTMPTLFGHVSRVSRSNIASTESSTGVGLHHLLRNTDDLDYSLRILRRCVSATLPSLV